MKVKTLFNKNHITIKQVVGDVPKHFNYELDKRVFYHHEQHKGRGDYEEMLPKGSKIKKESPLGFYYYSKTKRKRDWMENSTTEFTVWLTSKSYITLTYFTNYNGVYIDIEKRPWDLCPNEKAMADHYIDDLFKEVTSLFHICEEAKLNKVVYADFRIFKNISPFNLQYGELGNVKDIIFKDLFGDRMGPKFQTDKEKIESHGFDTITSFRNM